ncbi:XRCC4-like factor-domain-containing protein [Aspergillus californicus]
MPEKWQRLHLSDHGNIPSLLFQYTPSSSDYELYLTDLNYIWSERLDRKAILKKADEENTTIDPSEDREQFKVLLQKIGDGLQNKPGSKASLAPSGQGLKLIITSKLPAPLEQLRWSLYLSKEPQSSVTSHLLFQFIRAEVDRDARQKSLIEELAKKDWVLAKLFDKIEAMGIDLSSIFPGTSGLRSGRKGPTLAQAAKYIKGLAPFNEHAWLEELNKGSPDSGLAANIVSEILDALQASQLDSLKPSPDGWWEGLTEPSNPTRPSMPQDDGKKTSKAKPSADSMEIDTDTGTETDDEEFERQETPPGLKKPSKAMQNSPSARSQNDKDDTQSEDEDTNPLPRKQEKEKTQPPAMRPKPPTAKPKGLGTIGGKKQPKPKESSPSPEPSPSPSPSPSIGPSSSSAKEPSPPLNYKPPSPHVAYHTTDETRDGTTDDEEADKPQPRAQPQSQPPKEPSQSSAKSAPKPSRGLGVIGGKKKKEPEPEPEPEPQFESQPEPEPKKKKPLGKLGVIGGSKSKDKASAKPTAEPESVFPPPMEKRSQKQKQKIKEEDEDEGDIKHTPSPIVNKKDSKVKMAASAEPEREETEQERADRKREELKRQLAVKSKAPAKKKRKF